MANIGTTYDPVSTAQAMADHFVSGRRTLLDQQTSLATATEKGLNTLSSALSAFQTSLSGLTGTGKTLLANSAVFSDTTMATATATASAAAGTYSFFIEQVASAHQISYSGMQDFAGGGSLTLAVGATSFNVDLTTQPTWTVRDLAAAINNAAGNTVLSASVVTTGATSELVLTSKSSGSANTVSVTANAGTDATLAATLGGPANQLAPARDAILRVGSETGTAITQSTNTFSVIDGVTINVARAQSPGATPLTLTVSTDSSATQANAQAFVDAYNTLKTAIDGLVSAGDPSADEEAGIFARDSGIRALRDRLSSMVRASVGGVSLANFGITVTRQGTLSLDASRLTEALASNPTGLTTLIGSTAAGAESGIAGDLDTYLDIWSKSAGGQISLRKEHVSDLLGDLSERQTALDRQYDSAYERYLMQFTQLQALQSQMSQNSTLFDALFAANSTN
jgi:flagellar hook-associated protein 2